MRKQSPSFDERLARRTVKDAEMQLETARLKVFRARLLYEEDSAETSAEIANFKTAAAALESAKNWRLTF